MNDPLAIYRLLSGAVVVGNASTVRFLLENCAIAHMNESSFEKDNLLRTEAALADRNKVSVLLKHHLFSVEKQ